MNKFIILLTALVSGGVMAQQATAPVTKAPTPVAPAPTSSIMDIVNQKIKEQKAVETISGKEDTPGANRQYNTKGSDYDKNTETGMDDYKEREKKLKNKIEEIKRVREEALKQQLAYEAKLREAAIRKAEYERIEGAKSGSSGKTRARVGGADNSDYFEKQRQNAEGNTY